MAPVSTPEANAGSRVSQSSLLERLRIPCAKPSESTDSARMIEVSRVHRLTYQPPALRVTPGEFAAHSITHLMRLSRGVRGGGVGGVDHENPLLSAGISWCLRHSAPASGGAVTMSCIDHHENPHVDGGISW